MPKIVNHDAYRETLLAAATKLFAEHGYNIGMRDIAAALQVSKGTFYYYFPSKEALFEAVCERVVRTDVQALTDFAARDAPFAERLHTLLQYCLENETWFVQQFLILTDFVRVRGANAIGKNRVIQQATEEYQRAIMAYLKLDNLKDATGILIFINGLVIQRYLGGQQTDFEAMARWLVYTLTNGGTNPVQAKPSSKPRASKRSR